MILYEKNKILPKNIVFNTVYAYNFRFFFLNILLDL
jgi:hypothetical protein